MVEVWTPAGGIGSIGSRAAATTSRGGVGRFPDGRLAEVFITGTKVGTAAETNAQDAAIVGSLALQHGCPLETIRHALARRSVGGDGPLAALLNEMARDEAAALDEGAANAAP